MFFALNFFSILVATTAAAPGAANARFSLKPFKIDLSSKIPRLTELVRNTCLPQKALYPEPGQGQGIQLDFLRELQTEWVEGFDWDAQQAELEQYTVVIEGQTVHFVHEKSEDPDAILIILIHGGDE
ncbi:epoxide hydrolase N terminus-domain-containing protein [Mycena rosella]|uniref:Epoxide hydrolase N terminus-domain-containing protein n=1 Tax=Mycena rosella TaxID=1033263 RepID=A0AAD7G6X1_MYCRO|nr:epoxide hydrolase N terminus-domain-containing protein [Mycena rosella]